MRLKKYLIIVSLGITLVDFLMIALYHFQFVSNRLIYDICLAIVGSALLGFLYSVIEYQDSKRLALEKLDKISWEIKSELERIECYTPFEPIELIAKLYNEDNINKIRKITEDDCDFKAKHELISYLEENGHIIAHDEKDYADQCESIYKFKMESYRKDVEHIMKIYISLSKYRVVDIIEAYNMLSFVFGFSKHKYIREKIIQPILELMNMIKDSAFHFEYYFNYKDNNLAPCILTLNKLQSELFKHEIVSENHIRTTTTLSTFTSKLEANINHLKNFSIFNKEPKYQYSIKAVNQERVDL